MNNNFGFGNNYKENRFGVIELIIQNAIFSIIYPRINELRRKIFYLEDKLQDEFTKPFALTAIPDEAEPEIPRIAATSKFGHSNLTVALNTTQFIVQYDENYNRDINKCLSYIDKHIKKIYSVITEILDNQIFFSGLTVNLLIDELEGEDAIDTIIRNFCNSKFTTRPYDISNRVSFVISDKYYINISFSNVRLYKGIKGLEVTSNLKDASNCISVNIDINDRYAFNCNNTYRSEINEVDSILELTKEMLNEKVERFIKEGEIEL